MRLEQEVGEVSRDEVRDALWVFRQQEAERQRQATMPTVADLAETLRVDPEEVAKLLAEARKESPVTARPSLSLPPVRRPWPVWVVLFATIVACWSAGLAKKPEPYYGPPAVPPSERTPVEAVPDTAEVVAWDLPPLPQGISIGVRAGKKRYVYSPLHRPSERVPDILEATRLTANAFEAMAKQVGALVPNQALTFDLYTSNRAAEGFFSSQILADGGFHGRFETALAGEMREAKNTQDIFEKLPQRPEPGSIMPPDGLDTAIYGRRNEYRSANPLVFRPVNTQTAIRKVRATLLDMLRTDYRKAWSGPPVPQPPLADVSGGYRITIRIGEGAATAHIPLADIRDAIDGGRSGGFDRAIRPALDQVRTYLERVNQGGGR